MPAKLVVVEGPDRVGKETQALRLQVSLEAKGKRVKGIEVPFRDYSSYYIIYWMLRTGSAIRWPNVFQTIQFFNKLSYQTFLLPFHLLFCDYIIFDRWSLSSKVYGDAGGANSRWTRFINFFLVRGHHTIVLYGDSFKKGEERDSFEKHTQLQQDVRDGYSAAVNNNRRTHSMVTNDGGREEVHRKIVHRLKEKGLL